MTLNADQTAAFAAVQSGQNVFLTGPAGAGKSFLIRHIVDWAARIGKTIGITALTGCAALLLGSNAKTLHSWAGIGLGRDSVDTLMKAALKYPQTKRRWKKTDILIVDEISMMTPDLFEKLDAIGKRVRASAQPWGGLQLILCGDFFQLPPVIKGISGETFPGRFAFESAAWKAANLKPVLLHRIERQTDAGFQRVLNECRIGAPSAETIELLKSRQNLNWKKQMIKPTLLFSRNSDVEAINEQNVAALKKPLRVYEAVTEVLNTTGLPPSEIPCGEALERMVQKMDADSSYVVRLELCVGAQVMLLMNKDLEAGLANGSRGVVLGFSDNNIPIVQFMHGDPVAIEPHSWVSSECEAIVRTQIPLRVAYAITIHKSQGATLDCALIDIGSNTFEYGQAYVALSRVRSLDGLYVFNLNPAKIMAHPSVVAYYESLMDAADAEEAEASADSESTFGSELADPDWRAVVQTWVRSHEGAHCLKRVDERRATDGVTVFPPQEDVLSALQSTPLKDVKVVILGQDPYHGPGQAHGLSFSVQPGVPLPPSLKNIRKELLADLPTADWPATVGTLTPWARRGVLLLNTIFTVEQGNPGSHSDYKWETLSRRLLDAVAAQPRPVVFIAWGKYAQSVVQHLKLNEKHTVIRGVHPSPLSAHAGFFGSKPFSAANQALEAAGVAPVDWSLPAEGPSSDDPQ
jgi:ATP-dependent DNA helicase PIF1